MERPLSVEKSVHYTQGIGCETDRSPILFLRQIPYTYERRSQIFKK